MSLVEKIKKNISKNNASKAALVIGLYVLTFAGLSVIKYYIDKAKKETIVPNAIWLGNSDRVDLGPDLHVRYENIDEDSRRESILEFHDKYGNKQRLELIWDENHYPKIVYPEK